MTFPGERQVHLQKKMALDNDRVGSTDLQWREPTASKNVSVAVWRPLSDLLALSTKYFPFARMGK